MYELKFIKRSELYSSSHSCSYFTNIRKSCCRKKKKTLFGNHCKYFPDFTSKCVLCFSLINLLLTSSQRWISLLFLFSFNFMKRKKVYSFPSTPLRVFHHQVFYKFTTKRQRFFFHKSFSSSTLTMKNKETVLTLTIYLYILILKFYLRRYSPLRSPRL